MAMALLAVACSLAPAVVAANAAGRALPKPESVRPTLDESLRAYVPCRSNVAGMREGSVPAIMPDLAMRWANGFRERHAGVQFSMPPPYAGPQGRLSTTLREFLDGERDFALLTRELTSIDRAAFRRAHDGRDPIAVPVAMGSFRHFGFVDTLVLVVHESNPVTGLSFRQIDGIYSGERLRGHAPVRTWGDLGVTQAEWKERPVVALGGGRRGSEDSAKAATIRQRILNSAGREAAWNDRLPVMGDGEDNTPVWVAKSPGAIGITALGQLRPGVKAIAIAERDSDAPVAPTLQNVYDGRYPLIRSVDLLLAPSAEDTADPLLSEWARFLTSRDGQSLVLEQGVFLPLRAEFLQRARTQLHALDRACEGPVTRHQ